MKIAIIDDERVWREEALKYICNYFSESENKPEIDTYCSGVDFLEKGNAYDIVFLDIEMSGLDGFGTADKYKEMHPDFILVILTTHTELSRKGYLVNAFRYIDKIHMKNEIHEALDSAIKKLDTHKLIRVNIVKLGEMKIVIRDILYVETDKRNILIHTTDDSYISSCTMEQIESMLENEGFYRCHKSYIVNLDAIKSFDHANIVLHDGSNLMVSSRKYPGLKQKYLERKFFCANA